MSTAANAATAPQQQGGFRRFWRTLRQIFHEVTAAVFAVLALAWLNAALRAWNRDTAHWLIAAAKIKSAPTERKSKFTTLSGIPLERVYNSDPIADSETESSLGYPGEYPFTRGIYPTMYRGRFWTMRQYAGFGSATESNQRYRYLLSKGQAGLSVAFDLPTQIGMDSDHPLALGEVGKVGVAIDSLRDMEILFDGIPLEKISTSMTINATAPILLALYVAVARKQGANIKKLAGTVQNDILKEYIARGTYIYPVRPALRLVTDVFRWCRD